jgi:hypothetical protein
VKKFGFYAFGFLILIVGFSIYENLDKSAEEVVSEVSNTVQLGKTEQTFISLSETFAKQVAAFGFEFGDFSTISDFVGIVPAETARIEIIKDKDPFLTVFELQLPSENSYEEVITKIRAEVSLQQAVFGESSFYFVQGDFTTNILPLGKSVLAFRFSPKNFEEIRDFIASLVILQ